MDFLTYTLMLEEIAKHCASTAVTLSLHTALTTMTILDVGTDAQKQKYLPRLAQGELGTCAFTEPEAGSDVTQMQTRATRANGAYHLDGVKTWATNAALGDTYIVFAATDPKAKRNGLSAFIVDRRDQPAGLTLGQREPTLGLRGLDIRPIYLDDVAIPAENLLGPLNGGWEVLMRAFDRLRVSLAAVALGASEGALSLGIKFAIERKQFGVALAHKQALQNYIADSAVDIESLRQLTHYAAWLADTHQPYSAPANMAKYLGARVAKDTANKMLQTHGGYGFSDEYAISRFHRDVRALRVLGGTDELQRYLVAEKILGDAGVEIKP
jgi:alkylation response protein AidB-like acyl-CoA dehydrogenase